MGIVEAVDEQGAGRRRLRILSPATLEPQGEVDCAGADAVHAAVERARKAQSEWGHSTFATRRRVLERAVRTLVEHADEFVDVIVGETGKPRSDIKMVI